MEGVVYVTPPNTPIKRKMQVTFAQKKRRFGRDPGTPRKAWTITPKKSQNSLPMARQTRRGRKVKKQYSYKSPAYKKKAMKSKKKAKKSYKKSANKSVSQKNLYMSKGFMENTEAFGKVTDKDCVYVGHTTFDETLYARVIAFAIIRKILNKIGIQPTSIDQNLNLGQRYNIATSLGHSFVLTFAGLAQSGLGLHIVHNSGVDESMEIINQGLGLSQRIRDMLLNVSAPVTGIEGGFAELAELACYFGDGFDNAKRTFLGKIDFRKEKINISCRSELIIQNRTKAAATNDVDSTAIDNQPLQGYMYQGNGVPQTKTSGDQGNPQFWDFNRVTRGGLILAQANGNVGPPGVSPLHPSFKEPPAKALFMNCKMQKSVMCHPGQYGRYVLYSNFSGLINNVIGRVLVFRGAATTTNVWRSIIRQPGKYQFLSLEEVLNSGSNNFIEVAWQVQRTIGAFLTTTKKQVMLVPHTDVPTQVDGLPVV